jgi:phosphoglycolate phosphatase
MKAHTIIFDLDGTLIDSAPSIIMSLEESFKVLNIQPCKVLTSELIGPPLTETVASVLSDLDVIFLPEVIENFKKHYDEIGYEQTVPYAGVEEILYKLKSANFNLYLATNKRLIPTVRIVKKLGWEKLFIEIFSLDSFTPPLATKTEMLTNLNAKLKVKDNELLYVGDRKEDAEASSKSGMIFLWAKWGYGGDGLVVPKSNIIQKPSQILKYVNDNR